MKLSIIRRWRLMHTLDDRGPHWIDAPDHTEDPDVRAYRRELARVDELLRGGARMVEMPAPPNIEEHVMNAVRSRSSAPRAARKEIASRSRLARHTWAAAIAASILLCALWAWSRFESRATEDSLRRQLAMAPGVASPLISAADLSGRGIRTQLSALDQAVEEPLRSEAQSMQRDARAMAVNTASWLPKPWLALLTGQGASSR